MDHETLRGHRKDQATRLRELMCRSTARGVTLAITSGKGGVGKSNVAVNLSICLAAHGLRVTLVDVDMGLANADLLMNLQPRHTLSHVLAGVRSLESVCMEGPGGIRFVPGASGRNDLANLTEFDRQSLIIQLGKLQHSADMVVLDCGAGISRNVINFAQAAHAVLVVTTPQPTAVTDAYATIKVLHRERYSGAVSLFVNVANSRAEAAAAYRRVAGVSQRFLKFPVADSGYMLHDTAVELAVHERSPFVIRYPGANASAAIAALAGRMSQTYVERPGRGGLLRRVAGLFV
ncbi:MAG: MinD/ParA family protein [Planctomycetota bacterium]|jgi:flagellar biosynthesis protein FlhG